jgi:hypothetical protein
VAEFVQGIRRPPRWFLVATNRRSCDTSSIGSFAKTLNPFSNFTEKTFFGPLDVIRKDTLTF